jgi:predicted outer membrane repeat protein
MPRKQTYRPSFELLEDRWVPSTFTVTNLRDNSTGTPLITGSLRHAILRANNHPGPDTVVFQTGLQGTIKLQSGEMGISDSLVLTGSGPDRIKIDGVGDDDRNRIFTVLDDLPDFHTEKVLKVTLSRMTLLGGNSLDRGGAIANLGENLTLRDMVIRDNFSRTAGGGIYTAGPLRIENSRILNNRTETSGFVASGGGVYAVHDSSLSSLVPAVVIVNSKFSGNFAEQAGGIEVETVDLTIVNSTFTDNVTEPGGAAGGVHSVSNVLIIRDSTFRSNQAGGAGGGIAATNCLEVNITRCQIVGNSAQTGGGVASSAEVTTITNSRITGNSAGITGGGVVAGPTTIRGSTIGENVSQGSAGGLSVSGSLTLVNSSIYANRANAGNGGGIFLHDITAASLIRNCTISGNQATEGGGLRLSNNSAEVSVQNSTIAFNSAQDIGGISTSVARLSLTSTICAMNSSLFNGLDLRFGFTTFEASVSLLGHFSFDPDGSTVTLDAVTTALRGKDPLLVPLAFNGGPTATHALQKGSPAINKGSNPGRLTTDQRGGLFKRRVGTGVDIGAFERQ